MLAISGLHPVSAQTIAVGVDDRGTDFGLQQVHDRRLDDLFANGLDDRQIDLLGGFLHLPSGTIRVMDESAILDLAQGMGSDDQALLTMLLDDEHQLELELGDDRLTGEPGEVRQEDRQQDRELEIGDDRLTGEPGEVRQEDRQADRQIEVQLGDDRRGAANQPGDDGQMRGADDANRGPSASAGPGPGDSRTDVSGSSNSGPSQPSSTATSDSHGGRPQPATTTSAPAAPTQATTSRSSGSSSSSTASSGSVKSASSSTSSSSSSSGSSGSRGGGSHDGGGHH